MFTAQQFSLALTTTEGGRMKQSFAATPRFQVAKVKVDTGKKGKKGKAIMKSETVKDEDGNAVLARDAHNQLIVASQTIRVLPIQSKTGESLAKVTGLTGQDLMQFEKDAQKQMDLQSQAAFNAQLSTGYNVKRVVVNAKTGAFVYRLEMPKGLPTAAELSSDAAKLGFKLVAIEKTDAKPDIDAATGTVLPESPAKSKRSKK